ncbi:MAG: hypothetical protein AB7K68_01425 [Bacteriovoracia bacterium]
MNSLRFTKFLRDVACWSWCFGLVVIALDFLAVQVDGKRVSLSYLFFAAATAAAFWAEKREFGSRIFLYRLHDSIIYSPWKFLLLYFLWISVFSPFTADPMASLLYATNGWLSLFTVGVAAQFIFCERGTQGVILLPARLRLAFFFYSVTVGLLLLSTLAHLFFPQLPFGLLIDEQANLFLFFTIGFPFLIWDFLKRGRRLLPPWLTGLTMMLGAASTLLIARHFYQASLAFALASVVALFVYKQMPWRRVLFLAAPLAALAAALMVAIMAFLKSNGLWLLGLRYAQQLMESRMKTSVAPAVEILVRSKFLGEGLGLTSIRGVWPRVLAEAGVVGLVLYGAFFLSLGLSLYRVRRAPRVIVSNVSLISVAVFLFFVSHYVENPYGAYVWVWYAIWTFFASAAKKKQVNP